MSLCESLIFLLLPYQEIGYNISTSQGCYQDGINVYE